MITLLTAGVGVQRQLAGREWRFCFIGGVANYRWGTPRLTNDLGLTLLTGFGAEQTYVDALLEIFASRIPDPREFAAQHRVVLLRTAEGIGIDIALGAMPFERATVDRATVLWRPGSHCGPAPPKTSSSTRRSRPDPRTGSISKG